MIVAREDRAMMDAQVQQPSVPDAGAVPPEISVVILCYREEDRIASVLTSVEHTLNGAGMPYEIVLVANYLPAAIDRSADIAVGLSRQRPHVRVVAKPKEGMMGWDMRSGLGVCTGRVIAVMDGDGQIAPGDVIRAYRQLRDHGLDLCQTYRIRREDGWRRIWLSRLYNAVFRILFPGTGLHDINAKPKVMTRQAYERLQLTSSDWFIDAEIIIQARQRGLRLGEIHAVFGPGTGRPSYVRFEAVAEFVRNLLRMRIRGR